MRILVDMDGVICDFGMGFDEALDGYGVPASGIPRRHAQVTWDLHHERTTEERAIIAEIMVKGGFYANLTPIPGAKATLRALAKEGHDIRFVTSPFISNPTCASDKLNWIVQNYGDRWAQKVIITSDKTLVRGDVLIDDKPEIKGDAHPEWRHIIFDQPYNQHVDRPRLRDWKRSSVDAAILEVVRRA